MRRWCLWCGAVLRGDAKGAACAPCAAEKERQVDEVFREAMKAWAPPPKDDGNGGTNATS